MSFQQPPIAVARGEIADGQIDGRSVLRQGAFFRRLPREFRHFGRTKIHPDAAQTGKFQEIVDQLTGLAGRLFDDAQTTTHLVVQV
jgi:hypothetical protein